MLKNKFRLWNRISAVALILLFGIVLPLSGVFSYTREGVRVNEPTRADAATASHLNMQGRLYNASGSTVADGYYNIEFKLYDHLSAGGQAQGTCSGNCLWSETRDYNGGSPDNRVRTVNGYFSVSLGSIAGSLPTNIDWSQDLWITMRVGGSGTSPSWETNEMSPRLKLTAVPYALVAGNVRSGDTNTASTNSDGVNVTTGDALGATSNTGSINLQTGDATDGNSGNITLDVGTASGTAGTISLGASNSSGVTISRVGVLTSIEGNLDVTGSVAFKKGTDFSTTGTSNNVDFGEVSLVRLTGASAQTITGIDNGRDGELLTIVNAAAQAAFLNDQDTNSDADNRIVTGTGGPVTLQPGGTISLIYDSTATQWRVVGASAAALTGVGAPFLQGGNNFGADADLGTNDNFDLNLRTNNTTKATLTTSGDFQFLQASTIETIAGALTVDSAAALNLGTSDATSISIAQGGVTTTVNGALTVAELLTGQLGATISGADISLNDSSNFNTSINGGTSTGTITVGNAAAGAVTVDTAAGISLDAGAASNFTTSSGALTITSAAAATWGTSAGDLTLQSAGGTLNVDASTAQFSEVTGTRTLTVQTRTTNVAGSNLTISGGTAGSGASAFTGGILTLQGGDAAGTGNANGANVAIQGGDGIGTGVQGLVTVASTTFTASATQSFGQSGGTIDQSAVDNFSTIPIEVATGGPAATVVLPAPTQNVVGRILYLTALNGSKSFTVSPSGGVNFILSANASATFMWNGSGWTNAGVDSGSASFILNQSSSAQTTANFWISGTGRADTGFTSPLFSTADVSSGGGNTDNVVFRSGNLSVGSGTTGTVTLQSGDAPGGNRSTGNVVIDSGAPSGSGSAGTVSIGTTNASSIAIGSGSLGALTLDSGAGISIDAATASNFTVTGSAQDLTVAALGGGAQSLNLQSAGTGADAISIQASDAAGGIDIEAGTNGIAMDTTGAISLDSTALQSNFTLTANNAGAATLTIAAANAGAGAANLDIDAKSAITIDSAAAGVSIDSVTDSNFTVTGSGQDLTLAALGGGAQQVVIQSAGTGVNAIHINASDTAGGIDVDAGTGGVAFDTTGTISLDSTATASNFSLTANSGSNATLTLAATNAGAGTANIDVDAEENITLDSSAGSISLDSVAASNFTVTGSAQDLTVAALGGGAQSLNLQSAGTGADAISIQASDAAGGIDIEAGTNGIAMDTTGAISLDSTALQSNFTLTANNAGAATLTIAAANAGAGAANLDIDAKSAITIDSAAAGVSIDSVTDSNFTVTGSGQDLTLAALGGGAQQVVIQSAGTGVNAIHINASDTAGGIDVDAGTGGVAFDTTGTISLDSTATASNFTVTANSASDAELNISATNAGAGNASVTIAADNTVNINVGTIATNATTLNLFETTATTINIGDAVGSGGINLAGGSSDTGCTIDGSTGDLTCSGDVTSTAATGTFGYWDRDDGTTTLQPANAGDHITTSGNISTTGSGTITSAGLLTGSAGLSVTGTGTISTSLTTPTVYGSSAASGNLTLQSTSDATKGKILFGTSAYDEANNRLGIGTASPGSKLTVVHTETATSGVNTLSNLTYTISPSSAPVSSTQYRGITSVVTSTSANINSSTGLYGGFLQATAGNNTNAGTVIGSYNNALATGNGNITTAIGNNGLVQNTGTGTITFGYGMYGQVQNGSTGTISNAYSLLAAANTNSGGGTISRSYGVYVAEQTVGTSNYGIFIQGGSGTASNGITWGATGATGDTNLYRSNANELKTDDALVVAGLLTGQAGATISGGTINLNVDSSTNVTNINTGSTTGAVNIGNSTGNTAINLESGSSTLSLQSTTGGINIGTNANARTISIGTGAADQDITLGSTTTGSSVIIQAASADGIQVRADGTNAFRIQNGAGSTTIFNADVTNTRITIGGATTTLSTSNLTVSDVEITTRLRVGSTTNGISFNDGTATKLRFTGTARNAIGLTLAPEFAGAVLTGDGSSNIGIMTSDFCSTEISPNINADSVCAASQTRNYYSWTTTQGSAQDYDVFVKWRVPSNFGAFDTTPIQFNGYGTTGSDSARLIVYRNGTQCDSDTVAGAGWSLATSDPTTSCSGGSAIAAGDTLIFRITLSATNGNYARIGEININYLSVF